MKIVMLGQYVESELLTGPEKVTKRLFQEFKKQHRVSLFEYYNDGDQFSYRQKLFGFEEIHDSVYRTGVVSFVKKIISLQPDIVLISAFERFSLIAVLLKLVTPVKIVFITHGLIQFEDNLHKSRVSLFLRLKNRIAEFMFFNFCDHIVFVSNHLKKMSENAYGKIKSSSIIYNGSDYQMENVFSEVSQKKMITVMDESRPEKGTGFLLNITSVLPDNYLLTVVGEYPSLQNKFQNIIVVPKMTSEVYFNLLKSHRIFLLLSIYEPFSISALEALNSGLIPVVSDVSGISEIIKHNESGYIFESENADELIAVLKTVDSLNDTELRDISSAAVRLSRNFSWELVADRYLSLFESVRH